MFRNPCGKPVVALIVAHKEKDNQSAPDASPLAMTPCPALEIGPAEARSA